MFTVKKTDYGLVFIAVRRKAEEDRYYWRLTQFLVLATPSFRIKRAIDHGHCWVRVTTRLAGSGR